MDLNKDLIFYNNSYYSVLEYHIQYDYKTFQYQSIKAMKIKNCELEVRIKFDNFEPNQINSLLKNLKCANINNINLFTYTF